MLKRAFNVDPLICDRCGGHREILSYIFDPDVVIAILDCLGLPSTPPEIRRARATCQANPAFDA